MLSLSGKLLDCRYLYVGQTPLRLFTVAVLGFLCTTPLQAHRQAALDARQLASYQLTLPVFLRFAHATRLMAAEMKTDPRFARDPLFNREVAVAGEAVEMATALQNRLDNEPTLAAALFAADISTHEYATFALALFAARLAHGFLESGAMRKVPPGVPADNVAFVREHLPAIRVALSQLGLE
jgi:hypothetical protein